jgi:hypothetical protein
MTTLKQTSRAPDLPTVRLPPAGAATADGAL